MAEGSDVCVTRLVGFECVWLYGWIDKCFVAYVIDMTATYVYVCEVMVTNYNRVKNDAWIREMIWDKSVGIDILENK